MSNREHELRVVAFLRGLIAGASKRTPGPYRLENEFLKSNGEIVVTSEGNALLCTVHHECVKPRDELEATATFIASCAGNAERAWEAAIGHILFCHDLQDKLLESDIILKIRIESELSSIRINWPLERVQ